MPKPAHLPRTRIVYPAPAACPCCGGAVRKPGEAVSETLERLPARWFVVSHVREKVSCRVCEAVSEAPAPFHPIARGRAGRNRLAEAIVGKYGMHRPLNRQSAAFARAERSRPLVDDLHAWLRDERTRLAAKSKTAHAIDYLLKRWPAFTRFLADGRICLSNNAAERALRGIAVGRRNWTFAGSDAGDRRTAALYTPIETAKLNGIDPRAWLAGVLARLPAHPANRIDQRLPWNWQNPEPISTAA